MTNFAFGDSITVGAGASSTGNSYIAKLGVLLGEAFVNSAVSTAMVADQESVFGTKTIASGDTTVLAFGTNDQAKYDTDPTKRGHFIDGLRHYAVQAAAYVSAATPNNGVTFSGAWGNGYAYGCYAASAAGAKANFSVSGNTICLGFIRQYANTGTFRVRIDGADKGIFASGGDVRTLLGKAYGPMALAFSSLGAGSHTVEVEVLSANSSNVVFFRHFSSCTPKAKVCIVNIPHAVAYTYGGSSANVDTYNIAISALVTELRGYGLDVNLADVGSVMTSSDFYDNVHPNDTGHTKYTSVLSTILSPTPVLTFALTEIYKGSDGFLYAGDVGNLTKLATV